MSVTSQAALLESSGPPTPLNSVNAIASDAEYVSVNQIVALMSHTQRHAKNTAALSRAARVTARLKLPNLKTLLAALIIPL